MTKKDALIILIISLWGFIFLGVNESEMVDAFHIFKIKWMDVFKAVIVGTLIGMALRTKGVQSFVISLPFGELIISKWLGILGLGVIGIGALGALVVFWRFNHLDFVYLPLNFSVTGLSVYLIYFVSRLKNKA